jgi:striatin 1/3/4
MPTSVDWVRDDPKHMVTAYSNAECIIYDIETGKAIIKLDTTQVCFDCRAVMFCTDIKYFV